ncbi:MAG: hypothetical protein A2Y50_07280 [Pseudomonadales bacterium RIFCSPLOWO2_12_59_9]|nr:MAG: hypothetical protein A2Y50_07280 [Pseudomonadales bacterium RIFCSPLOWO2_12_59_9]
MTSPKLLVIQRQLKIQTEETTTTDSLAAAIQMLVEREVESALARHRERPRQAFRTRALLQELPQAFPRADTAPGGVSSPSVKTPAPIARDIFFQRNELGRVISIKAGALQFRVIRDELGRPSMLSADTMRFCVQRGVDGRVVRLVPVPPTPLN